MRLMSGLLFVALILFSTLGPRAEAQDRRAFWRDVQRLCDASARLDPNEAARGIAAIARAEHAAWGGHRIDAAGRLTRFGPVESEAEFERSDGARATLGALGWWNVWRYWSELDAQNLVSRDGLFAVGVSEAAQKIDPARIGTKRRYSIAELLARLPLAVGTPQRDIVEQSVIRAAMSDVPWSAAFVSYVIHRGAPTRDRDRFRFDAAHRGYIDQAIESTKEEVAGRTTNAFYRACPVHATRPRAGDILCYQREDTCRDVGADRLRDFVAFGDPIPASPSCTRIARTHCDIVGHIDGAARKLETIGGNVFHSVALRRMNLTRRGMFSPNQGPCDGEDCSLNHRDWFVLLQMR